MIANYANVTYNHKYYVVNAWAIISGFWIKNHLLSPKHSQRPSLKFEWNRLVSPRFEWTIKFERSPRIEGITLRSPRIECFTYFWGWSSTWLRMHCLFSSSYYNYSQQQRFPVMMTWIYLNITTNYWRLLKTMDTYTWTSVDHMEHNFVYG